MIRYLHFLFFTISISLTVKTASAQSKDIPGPAGSGQFGYSVTVLPNGNYVVTDPYYDEGGKVDIGAVYLYNGKTHAQISKLTGSTAGDNIGIGGITILTNGNYVIKSISWDNGSATDAGAVTWASGSTGVSGVVSISNSLIGSKLNDQVGSGGVTALSNGNYVVASSNWDNGSTSDAGAVTWGNGLTGVSGVIGSVNSLIGSAEDDQIGSYDIVVLSNSNYVVISPYWNYGTAEDAGAVTWCSGVSGISSVINSSNSLIGTKSGDYVGLHSVSMLTNGNYVVNSPYWGNGGKNIVGAVTWGSGFAGVSGVVSSGNSLVGTTSGDVVGYDGVTVLTNGNYVITSYSWTNGTIQEVGAVTWGSGTEGVNGTINNSNSLIGERANDQIGLKGITVLTNGNYVISSPEWDNESIKDAGAVTWANGVTGLSGLISSSNSLVGTIVSEKVGSVTIAGLSNGNYVVRSESWNNGLGAVTWGNGLTGLSGVVSSSNSLIGTGRFENFGVNGITALTNGNYVVCSPSWYNGEIPLAGAVTWCNGSTGFVGIVSTSNSLVGANRFDAVGTNGVKALSNGNYVVLSPNWATSGLQNLGAVTWGDGSVGTVGVVGSSNSLVGIKADDDVGLFGVTTLSNGSYVVKSSGWANGTGIEVGAITWGSGSTGVSGPVSSNNSLLGTQAYDFSDVAILELTNSNFVVRIPNWDNGSLGNAGAITWGSGNAGVNGIVSKNNSLLGFGFNDQIGNAPIDVFSNGDYLISRLDLWDTSSGKRIRAVRHANGAVGLSGETNNCNSVIPAINGFYTSRSFSSLFNYFVVGLPFENKLTIFTPTGMNPATTLDETTVDISGAGSVPLIADADCRIIASIATTGNEGSVQGVVHAKTWVEGSVPTYDGHPFVARHYQITPDDNASTATGRVTLYFTQAEFTAFNSHSGSTLNLPANGSDAAGKYNLRIVKFSGTSNDDTGLPGSYENGSLPIDPDEEDIVWNAELERWEVSFEVEGFSGFIVQTEFDPLPVRLISFKGKVQENKALLDWTIADAYHFSHFELERSKDAKSFELISNVELTKEKSSYQFTDENASHFSNDKNRVYYRLKLLDLDGTYAYSKIAELPFAGGNDDNYVYPNPFAGSLGVAIKNHNGETVNVDLRNQSGELLLSRKVSVAQNKLDFNTSSLKLSSGTYILTIQTVSEVINLKVVKE